MTEMGGLIAALVISRHQRFRSASPMPKTMLYLLVLVASLSVVGSLAYNQGVRLVGNSIVAGIASATPIITVLSGKLFFREKLTRLQYCAIGLIIIGIISISIL